LLEDFLAILREETQGHFIGIIIYLGIAGTSFSEHKLYVIDGQQRLTTLFLMLFAIRQICEENGDTRNAFNFTNNYILNNEARVDDMRLKLKPLRGGNDVYFKIANQNFKDIHEEDKSTNLYKSYIHIYNFFKYRVREYSIDQIREAMRKLYLVDIPLCENDNPQQIFESINSKGSPLLAIDLVRNFVLMQLDGKDKDKLFESYWRKIENLFSSDGELEEFLRIFLINQSKKFVNKKNIYSSFRDYYNQSILLGNEMILGQILSFARHYDEIYFKDINLIHGELKNVLIEFRMIESVMPAPFLIEIYKLYKEQKLSSKLASACFNLIITFLLRRAIIGMNTSSITKLFTTLPSVIESYFEGIDYDEMYNRLVDRLIYMNLNGEQRMPSDYEIRDVLKDKEVYGLKNPLKIIFTKIENYNNSAPVDTSKLQIEHLLPQNGEKWAKSLNISEEEYQIQLNRIGNLTFASKSDNIAMSNNLFEYKKEILKNTGHLKINQNIINLEKWDIEEIEKRTHEMIDQIIFLYPYPDLSSISRYERNRPIRAPRKIESRLNNISPNEVSGRQIIHQDKIFDEKYSEASNRTRELYDNVKKYIFQLGPDISEQKQKYYTAFKKTNNIICIEIGKTFLKCSLRLNPIYYQLSEKIRDVTNIGHWGTGDLQLYIYNETDLNNFKFIFEDAYHKNS
jgi:uncharacterized protein with ParB-like and HNH nuclease domain/predicted transport protein